jgi:hypothetical protein
MSHPEILVIPLLMLADYFLTIIGTFLAERAYRRYFKFSDYELNPIFQKAIAAKKWINFKHLALVILVTVLLIFSLGTFAENDAFYQAIFGGVLTVYTAIVGAHLANIWTFGFLAKHPEQVTGEVTMSYRYQLNLTRARMLCSLLPVAGMACLTRSPFAFGGIAGIAALMLALTIWLWRDGRKRRRAAALAASL